MTNEKLNSSEILERAIARVELIIASGSLEGEQKRYVVLKLNMICICRKIYFFKPRLFNISAYIFVIGRPTLILLRGLFPLKELQRELPS